MKVNRVSITIVVGMLVLLCVPALRGDVINFTLTQTTQSGAPGDTLTFQGTLSNPTANPYPLSDSYSMSAAFLTLDDTAFILNTPATLGGGAVVGPVDLFSIMIGAAATPGTYTGNFFDITDGAGTTLATQQFTVTVAPSVASVPEPASIALLGAGIASIACKRKRLAASKP